MNNFFVRNTIKHTWVEMDEDIENQKCMYSFLSSLKKVVQSPMSIYMYQMMLFHKAG